MLRLESLPEGFALSVDGRKVLVHTRRSPCIEIGRSERSAGRPARRLATTALRGFKIVESSEVFVALDFEGKITLAARFAGGRLHFSFSRYELSVDSFRLRLVATPDESIYGCGERYARIDHKLSRVPLRVEDEAPPAAGELFARAARRVRDLGTEGPPSPFPIPVFASSAGYWCAIELLAPATLDFRRRASTLIESRAVPREIVLGFASDPPSLLADMSSALGRQASPPEWAFDGAILGIEGGTEGFKRKLEAVIGAGASVAAVWARDWCGRRPADPGPRGIMDGTWDPALYPELPSEIAGLRARGIRFIGQISDLLSLDGKLYAQASARGWCVKGADGADCIISPQASPCALLDLSDPEAFVWMKELIKREMIGIGMGGWIADSCERLPSDAVLASGADPATARNEWPGLWARVNSEAIEEAGRSGEILFFVRSGWLGSARLAPACWAGERLSDFSRDGFPSLVPAALSLGLSGIGFWHSEIGGSGAYGTGKRSADCLARWIEAAAFTPFFRTGDRPEAEAQPWSSPLSLALFSRMSGIFAALKPYHVATAAEYSERGLPPMRQPWIHYPSDPATRGLSRQYLYGRDLMVAPSSSSNASLTALYLPEDEWIHLWSSRRFAGGRVVVASPPGCPAVFYRASSPYAALFDVLRRTVRRL